MQKFVLVELYGVGCVGWAELYVEKIGVTVARVELAETVDVVGFVEWVELYDVVSVGLKKIFDVGVDWTKTIAVGYVGLVSDGMFV